MSGRHSICVIHARWLVTRIEVHTTGQDLANAVFDDLLFDVRHVPLSNRMSVWWNGLGLLWRRKTRERWQNVQYSSALGWALGWHWRQVRRSGCIALAV